MSEEENRAAVLRKKSAVRDLMQEAFDRIDDPKNSCKGGLEKYNKFKLFELLTDEVVEVMNAFLDGDGDTAMECGDVLDKALRPSLRIKSLLFQSNIEVHNGKRPTPLRCLFSPTRRGISLMSNGNESCTTSTLNCEH